MHLILSLYKYSKKTLQCFMIISKYSCRLILQKQFQSLEKSFKKIPAVVTAYSLMNWFFSFNLKSSMRYIIKWRWLYILFLC